MDNSGETGKVPQLMKNDSVIRALQGLLAASALASVVLVFFFCLNARSLRSIQIQASNVNQRRMAWPGLINDAVEYSKKNPAIDPLLEAIGAKPPKNAPAAAAAPTKAATK